MRSVENITRASAGIIVSEHAKSSAGFGPNVVWLGRMHATSSIVIFGGIGDLRRIGISRRNQAVEKRSGGITQELLWAGGWAGLGKVVILQCNHEYRVDLLHDLSIRDLSDRVSGGTEESTRHRAGRGMFEREEGGGAKIHNRLQYQHF